MRIALLTVLVASIAILPRRSEACTAAVNFWTLVGPRGDEPGVPTNAKISLRWYGTAFPNGYTDRMKIIQGLRTDGGAHADAGAAVPFLFQYPTHNNPLVWPTRLAPTGSLHPDTEYSIEERQADGGLIQSIGRFVTGAGPDTTPPAPLAEAGIAINPVDAGVVCGSQIVQELTLRHDPPGEGVLFNLESNVEELAGDEPSRIGNVYCTGLPVFAGDSRWLIGKTATSLKVRTVDRAGNASSFVELPLPPLCPDAGVPADAGAPDAGAPDAGTPPDDAGQPDEPPGGCCSQQSGSSNGTTAFLMGAALALWLTARSARRRARRR